MKNKSFGQRLSSPFKPRESQLRSEPSASDTEAGTAESTQNREVHVQGSPRIPEKDVAEQRPVLAFPMKVEVDPRQRQMELLKKQLRELQEEVKQYEREVERSRSAPRDEEEEDISSLITLVNKANPLPPVKQPEAPPLSSLLSAFLPLAKPINLPTPPPDEPEKPLPSHEPIELDDPLPYLQLFTSFSYDSEMGVTGDARGQVHTVNMHSPASLLHLGFQMTADSATQTVSKLEVLSLSPWASHELGAYIKQRAAENDVSAVCWATESYYDLAVKRANCWARCYKGFSRLLNDSTASKTAEASRKAKHGKGPQQAVPSSSNFEEEAEEVSGIGHELAGKEQDGHPVSKAELMRGLGRESIVFRSKEVLFKVAWRIQFDWTGEAESVVNVGVALPGVWREADDRGSFKKIPATFDRLVEEMGVFEAIKTMVGLLFT
ncbi:hypothetical protein MPH_02562 [Macrophomina phaseolina MS6]|uniref:Uncharacterized protein n=1 Tax=Macrophomina phaseolina (strain MS6) TaxID=1126212 RepID=K2S556_MACPH|nr:hypothetical protein MPH_02562 [Macrophomina phaseolina MS6]